MILGRFRIYRWLWSWLNSVILMWLGHMALGLMGRNQAANFIVLQYGRAGVDVDLHIVRGTAKSRKEHSKSVWETELEAQRREEV